MVTKHGRSSRRFAIGRVTRRTAGSAAPRTEARRFEADGWAKPGLRLRGLAEWTAHDHEDVADGLPPEVADQRACAPSLPKGGAPAPRAEASPRRHRTAVPARLQVAVLGQRDDCEPGTAIPGIVHRTRARP